MPENYGAIPPAAKSAAEAEKAKVANSGEFVRKTTKYWVHKDDIEEVKAIIESHLPEYRFSEKVSRTVQSVYLDNVNLDRYHERIHMKERSMVFRYRWYGNGPPTTIWMEQKIRRFGWRGQTSTKLRFNCDPKKFGDYLKGTYIYHEDPTVKCKPESRQLAAALQNHIVTKNMFPVIRTSATRYCFQTSATAPVRVSFDENLQLSKMRDFKYDCLDYTKDFNFRPEEVYDFPHAILEIKIQCQGEMRNAVPRWGMDLISAGLITEVDKFSKFNSAIAILLHDQVAEIPYYIPCVEPFRAAPTAETLAAALADAEERQTRHQSSLKDSFLEYLNLKQPEAMFPSARPAQLKSVRIEHPVNCTGADKEWARESHARTIRMANRDHHWQLVVPIRVDPRLFMAVERTFLKWSRVAILAMLLGAGALTYNQSVTGAAAFLLGGLVIMLRHLYLYYFRANTITRLTDGSFYDPWSPLIFTVFFLVGLVILLALGIGPHKAK